MLSMSRFSSAAKRFAHTKAQGQALVGKHVLSTSQFDRDTLNSVMAVSKSMHDSRATSPQLSNCAGMILGSVFYEPSTRTASSFNTAMYRLGGNVVHLSSETSSAKKGETIQDTVRVMENYADVLAIRHPVVGSVAEGAEVSSIPVLNAGDGKGEHPTQALLDVFCMLQELKRDSLDGITVTMVGDLENGRTVHSLASLLGVYDDVTLNYVSPPSLAMPDSIQEVVAAKGVTQHSTDTYRDVIQDTDVFYMTRVQRERFESDDDYNAVAGLYVLKLEELENAREDMVIMHPLPRVDELDVGLDSDPRAAYFRQAGYGLSTRMALLAMCLGRA